MDSFFHGRLLKVWLLMLVAFVVGEQALRVRARARFGSGPSMTMNDPVEGRSLRPGTVREGSLSVIHINSSGFRGEECSRTHHPNSLRIVVMGSSTIFGGNVNDEETIPGCLKKRLDEILLEHGDGTWSIEVINAGIPGMTLEMNLKHLQYRVLPLHPDIVILYPSLLDVGAYLQSQAKPEILNPLRSWRYHHSVFYNTFTDKFVAISPRSVGAQYRKFPEEAVVFFEKQTEKWIDMCLEAGVRPVLMTEASAARRGQPFEKQYRLIRGMSLGFGVRGSVRAGELLNEGTRKAALSRQCAFIDILDAIPPEDRYYVDNVHFSREGAALVGQVLAERMFEAGLIRRKADGRGKGFD